jgi:hypothetical protein
MYRIRNMYTALFLHILPHQVSIYNNNPFLASLPSTLYPLPSTLHLHSLILS